MAKKVTLDECREMLVSTSFQFRDEQWKEMFSVGLEAHGWGYDEFRIAMQTEYKQLIGGN